ncbi:alpha-hydroxy acid oxidase [Herbiconiux ginsengi]|uniref:L-lactate dehydrogenase (Cytochrome) n=1 Tax=Herbiconiux ginsengi TaxID=381665 RepID=A0A1H3TUZ2_9MICO|nr:alpha-hydroxy acid oxidase [Herbiconiux ginsengi]SDZ54030.1 L-lactate dehydrogenase (cytochrome) [Herbiconiux ginsengi]
MVARQIPDLRALARFVTFKPIELNGKRRRLASALTIDDLRTIARKRTPRGAFDYTDGAAEGEISLERARRSYREVEFNPEALRPVAEVDPSTNILGARSALPFAIAPTGFTRLMHSAGEEAGAAAAAHAGIPFTLSTLGTTSIEGVHAVAPEGRNWFQLYMFRDREISYELVQRAQETGFDTLFLTIDCPVAGARMRDVRNGFTFPPRLGVRTFVDAAPRPWWWFDLLTTRPLELASIAGANGSPGEVVSGAMDPTLSIADLRVLREMWPGNLVVKGVQTVHDARRVVDAGADGIVLSNHGGRQLDRSPIPFHLLPAVVREVGDETTIMIDSGIMNGADIVAAVALGADFALIGRAYLYGLMAGGREGVDRTIDILHAEIRRTLFLLGVASLAELEPRHVTQLVPERAGVRI